MNHKHRNYAMDGLKLLFMLVIVVHHSGYVNDIFSHGCTLMRTHRSKPDLRTWSFYNVSKYAEHLSTGRKVVRA